MRIVTTETKVYKYEELTDDGKQKAREKWQENDDFPQGREAIASLKAFVEHFGARLDDWRVDYTKSSYSSAKFSTPDDPPTEKELRESLKALGSFNRRTLKGHGDCVLTGVGYDESAIDGFRWAFYRQKERDLERLLEAGFRSWLKDVQSEYEYQYTDEAFREMCDANGYEFTADGAGRCSWS